MNEHLPIAERVRKLLAGIPSDVTVLAAAKTRTAEEIAAAIEGGIRLIGYNYVQKAAASFEALGRPHAMDQGERAAFSDELTGHGETGPFEAHLIGHLQRNKVKTALRLFDVIETVDYVTTFEGYEKTAGVRREVFGDGPYPAATGVKVAGLIREGALIEIRAVAWLG